MKSVPLAEVCEILIGRTPSRSEPRYWNGELPWLSIADMNQGRDLRYTKERVTSVAQEECKLRVIEPGTVVMSFKLSIGKVGIAKTRMATNEAIAALRVKNQDRLDPVFLSRVLESMDLAGGANRAAMGNTLNKASLALIKIPVPPLEEQRRIAAILDKADELRTKRRQALAHLDTLTQSIFHSMFGSRHDAKTPLGNVIEVRTGGTPSRADASNYGGKIPWVKTTEVRNEPILQTGEHLTDRGVQASNCTVFPANAVVIAMYGQGKTRGQVGLLQIPAATNQACAVLLPRDDIEPAFLFHQLKGMYTEIRALGRGGNQENLNLSLVRGIPIVLPPLEVQRTFATRVAAVERLKENHRKHLAELDTLFASLQHRAFRGEL